VRGPQYRARLRQPLRHCARFDQRLLDKYGRRPGRKHHRHGDEGSTARRPGRLACFLVSQPAPPARAAEQNLGQLAAALHAVFGSLGQQPQDDRLQLGRNRGLRWRVAPVRETYGPSGWA